MSARIYAEDVLFLQRLLKCEGIYDRSLHGRWGPLTEGAAAEFERRSEIIKSECGAFGSRPETPINSLTMRAQREAVSLILYKYCVEITGQTVAEAVMFLVLCAATSGHTDDHPRYIPCGGRYQFERRTLLVVLERTDLDPARF